MSIASSRLSSSFSLASTLQRTPGSSLWGTSVVKFSADKIRGFITGIESEEVLRFFQSPLTDDEIIQAVNECSKSVALLDRTKKKLLEEMFRLEWWNKSKVYPHFHRWAIDLLTAQVYHTPLIMTSIMIHFSKDENYTEETKSQFTPLHKLVAEIVSTIPLSADILIKCATDNFPYYKRGCAQNCNYIHNLLWITQYMPVLKETMLTIIINRLTILDVNIKYPEECDEEDRELFTMDLENNSDTLIYTLDMCMMEMFQWIEQENPEDIDVLFSVFERTLLPTFGTRNIQYLFLYSLSRNIAKLNSLLDFLWKIVESARVGPDLRQSSIVYLGGILARANFTPPELLNFYVKKMADWCHTYIKAQDSIQSSCDSNPHVVFYSVCQTLFYLLAFKHKHFFSNKSKLTFVESLGLPKIVMSSLNPLRLCQPAVVECFASITRLHQIVYCHAVIEHNMRNYLIHSTETIKHLEWFPFDPYMLPKSFIWIKPIYSEYEEIFIDNTKNVDGPCDEDDFLARSPYSDLPGSLPKFSFSNMRQNNL